MIAIAHLKVFFTLMGFEKLCHLLISSVFWCIVTFSPMQTLHKSIIRRNSLLYCFRQKHLLIHYLIQ